MPQQKQKFIERGPESSIQRSLDALIEWKNKPIRQTCSCLPDFIYLAMAFDSDSFRPGRLAA